MSNTLDMSVSQIFRKNGEKYMDREIITLKNMAVGVNVMDAFMKTNT